MGRQGRRKLFKWAILLVSAVIFCSIAVYMREWLAATKRYTDLKIPSAKVRVYSYSPVILIKSDSGALLQMSSRVSGTVPAGWTLVIDSAAQLDIKSDSVEINRVPYSGTESRWLALRIESDGSVTENAAIARKDRLRFRVPQRHPFDMLRSEITGGTVAR